MVGRLNWNSLALFYLVSRSSQFFPWSAQGSREEERAAPGTGTCQLSACVTFADTSLANGRHWAKFRIEGRVGRDAKATHGRKGKLHWTLGAVALIG